MTFQLTEQDWADAEAFLTGKPHGTKLSKYPKEYDPITPYKIKWLQLRKHSFVIIDNVIYAQSNKESFRPIVEGDAIYKKGLTKRGKEVIIKKVDHAIDKLQQDFNNIQIDTKEYQADLLVNFNTCFLQKKISIENFVQNLDNIYIKEEKYQKELSESFSIYSIVSHPSKSLVHKFANRNQPLSATQKLIYSLRVCLLMQKLHDENIIYKVIKEENFSSTIEDHQIDVKFNNFMFARFLEHKEKPRTTVLDWAGLIGYLSPEAASKEIFSVFSDIYSLAIMLIFQCDITNKNIPAQHYKQYIKDACTLFEAGLWLDPIKWIKKQNIKIEPDLEKILFGMLDPYAGKRVGINYLIVHLCEKLIRDETISYELQQEFNSLVNQYKPRNFYKRHPTLLFSSPFDKSLPDIFAQIRPKLIPNQNTDEPLEGPQYDQKKIVSPSNRPL